MYNILFGVAPCLFASYCNNTCMVFGVRLFHCFYFHCYVFSVVISVDFRKVPKEEERGEQELL